ncbi:hypothetical protein HDU91_003938 [Kappamyces sp. JEL0680]|nr:hypothetical protein HDU91_003938 [Kappamyces sp. JEL0680]
MHQKWQLLLDAVEGLLLGSPISAEKLCRKTLRRGQHYLDNSDRIAVARRLYGVACLRARLNYICNAIFADFTAWGKTTQTIALITLYVAKEEAIYFPLHHEDGSWIAFAATTLTPGQLSTIASVDVDSIVWPLPLSEMLCAKYSLPSWLATAIFEATTDAAAAAALAQSLNFPASITFRCNLFKSATRSALMQLLSSREGVQTKPCVFSPHGLVLNQSAKPEIRNSALNREGYFEVQDEGSQLIALATGVQPGMAVVDLCCGRGGKALHLADMLGRNAEQPAASIKGRLVLHDVEEKILREAKHRLEARPGIFDGDAVEVAYCCSGTSQTLIGGRGGDVGSLGSRQDVQAGESTTIDTDAIRKQLPSEGADVVLVDAPCSSLGTLRRGPNVRWEIEPAVLDVFEPLQRSILMQAQSLLKPGGVLVYATCTFRKQECRQIQDWFENVYSGVFRPAPLSLALGATLAERLGVRPSDCSLQVSTPTHDTDCFFIARWMRL